VGTTFIVTLPLKPGAATVDAHADESTPLPPMRILVVDDVPQTIELLQIVLGQAGHRVAAAQNGEKAVRAVLRDQFDVVLMDVQMPGTDGLEATRRIRAQEQTRGLMPTPIVALSASVQRQDQDAARAAGMNGFATKPVELPRLMAEIARVTGLGSGAPALPPQRDIDPDDVPVFDRARGLRFWGEAEALDHAIRHFCRDHQDSCDMLEQHFAAGDYMAARAVAHRVHGVAANLSLLKLHTVGKTIERALAQGDTEQARSLLPRMRAAFNETLVAVEHQENGPAGVLRISELEATDRIDWAAVKNSAVPLLAALRRSEIAEDALARLRLTLTDAEGRAQFAPIQTALDDFAFEPAIQLVAALLERARSELRDMSI